MNEARYLDLVVMGQASIEDVDDFVAEWHVGAMGPAPLRIGVHHRPQGLS